MRLTEVDRRLSGLLDEPSVLRAELTEAFEVVTMAFGNRMHASYCQILSRIQESLKREEGRNATLLLNSLEN